MHSYIIGISRHIVAYYMTDPKSRVGMHKEELLMGERGRPTGVASADTECYQWTALR